MGKIIYTKQLPAKITTHPTYLSFLLPFYLLVMLSMYKVQKCHTFFFGLVPFPPSRISLFFKFIYIILDITLQFETIFAAQNASMEQSFYEKTLTISRIPFQTNVVTGQWVFGARIQVTEIWKLVWSVSFLSRTLNNLNRTYVLMIMKPWSFQHLLDHTGSSKRSV